MKLPRFRVLSCRYANPKPEALNRAETMGDWENTGSIYRGYKLLQGYIGVYTYIYIHININIYICIIWGFYRDYIGRL